MPEPAEARASAVDATRFAHASEAEMARILDFYDVRWEYEPTTFPILWNLDGDVVESFAPDFYLPELEVFLEMTTLKQRLVRKKNRKLRRLRELYPGIRIKLFYARDFRAMMLKYGRLGLAASLSGTLGQVMPERADVAETQPVVAAGDVVEPVHGEAGGQAPHVAPRALEPRAVQAPAGQPPAVHAPAGEPPAPEPPTTERHGAKPGQSPSRRSRSRRRRRPAAVAAPIVAGAAPPERETES
jgi:hypothetical protein